VKRQDNKLATAQIKGMRYPRRNRNVPAWKHGEEGTEVLNRSVAHRLSSFRVVAQVTILLLICGVMGCKTSSPSQIVSPRIIGRVVEAQSHQPIKDAKVRRVNEDQDRRSPDVQRGGQMI